LGGGLRALCSLIEWSISRKVLKSLALLLPTVSKKSGNKGVIKGLLSAKQLSSSIVSYNLYERNHAALIPHDFFFFLLVEGFVP